MPVPEPGNYNWACAVVLTGEEPYVDFLVFPTECCFSSGIPGMVKLLPLPSLLLYLVIMALSCDHSTVEELLHCYFIDSSTIEACLRLSQD